MGHRANYVVIEADRTEIYVSGWGGLSIAHDIFFGPEITAHFMRSHISSEVLLDDVWCEGAALLDMDRKTLILFSWYLLDDPVVARHYTALVRQSYPEWNVQAAPMGIRDICTYAGRDIREVISENPLLDDDLADMPYSSPEPSPTDVEALNRIEGALLEAEMKSRELEDWLQQALGDKGLTPIASHFVRPDGQTTMKVYMVQERIARYRNMIEQA